MVARHGRYDFLILLLLTLLLGTPISATADDTPPRLRALLERLPAVGAIVHTADLGVSVGSVEKPPPEIPGGYNFRISADLDRRQLDAGDLHLNQPLHVTPSDTSFLFMSDQPEALKDDRLREDGTHGATGTLARADLPARGKVRVLIDHTDDTRRPLRYMLVFVPQQDGSLAVLRRGMSQHADSVQAGMEAFSAALGPALEPRVPVMAGQPCMLVNERLLPTQTLVGQMEFVATVPGQLYSVALEADAPVPDSPAALAALPVLHSVVWREEEGRLGKFIDPKLNPTRYARILDSYQHSRGAFHFPDRMGSVTYDHDEWADAVQAYSLFESIPGTDATMAQPNTDNRGKYGAVTGLDIGFARLPPGCKEVAVVMVNTGATWGGESYVTDLQRQACDLFFLPKTAPGVLHSGEATTVWRGPLQPGRHLRLWSMPMANLSVSLWYLVVPVP